MPQQLNLCVFYYPLGCHFSGWRLPGAEVGTQASFEHFAAGAQMQNEIKCTQYPFNTACPSAVMAS